MNRDFIMGVLVGLLLAIVIVWLLDSGDGHTPRKARQGVQKDYNNPVPITKVG